MKIILAIILFTIMCSNILPQSIDSLLDKTLQGVNALQCVSYTSKYNNKSMYYKMAVDTNDKYVGARFLAYEGDSTKLSISYHDGINASYFWNRKMVAVDTFRNHVVTANSPFLIVVRELLKYSQKNKSNIKPKLKIGKKSFEFTFTFLNCFADFTYLIKPVRPSEGTNTTYVLTTDRFLMPFKILSTDGIHTYDETILKMKNYDEREINKRQQSILLPEGFEFRSAKNKLIIPTISENQEAPQFSLKNLEEVEVQLKDYLGKVVLLEFTALGCSACEAAVPFLKTLAEKNDQDFAFISIMCYTNNVNSLKRYTKKNKLNYDLLIADDETIKNYKVIGTPLFVLLDKRGTIKWANMGYTNEETGKKIWKQIEQVLD